MAAQTQTEMVTVDAVYENGVLRLLEPLDLPEHTQVRVSVPKHTSSNITREDVRKILASVGLELLDMPVDGLQPMSEEAQEKLRREIGSGVDLSGAILDERETQL